MINITPITTDKKTLVKEKTQSNIYTNANTDAAIKQKKKY